MNLTLIENKEEIKVSLISEHDTVSVNLEESSENFSFSLMENYGKDGKDGKSAFEIWKDIYPTGTIEEFLSYGDVLIIFGIIEFEEAQMQFNNI